MRKDICPYAFFVFSQIVTDITLQLNNMMNSHNGKKIDYFYAHLNYK